MIEGGTGDLLVLGNKEHPFRLSAPVEDRPTGEDKDAHKEPYYTPGAPVRDFTGEPPRRINWYARDPHWKDVKGFRGKEDVEKPVGEWNTLECLCDGDKITVTLNGKVMNMATKCNHMKGNILFQSEGAEVFFRRIDLKPLKK
jgi:hypothetical protein